MFASSPVVALVKLLERLRMANTNKYKSPSKSLATLKASIKRVRENKAEITTRAISMAVGTAAGAAVGFMRGRWADEKGDFNFPKTQIAVEPVLGGALGLAGVFGIFGKYDEEVVTAGTTILGVYAANLTEDATRRARLAAEAAKK